MMTPLGSGDAHDCEVGLSLSTFTLPREEVESWATQVMEIAQLVRAAVPLVTSAVTGEVQSTERLLQQMNVLRARSEHLLVEMALCGVDVSQPANQQPSV